MLRKRRIVGSNPTQGSSFFFEKRVALGLLNCVPLPNVVDKWVTIGIR